MSSISRSEFKYQIQHIDPIDFEEFVADVWSHRGWKTSLTSASHDRGIDVIATWNGVISRKEAIQVKRYQSDKISSREVQRYASIPNQEGDIDNVIIVTSSSFSQPAQEVADELNVKTVDGDDLYQIITENSLSSIVSTYLEADNRTENTIETGTSNNTQSTQSETSNSVSIPEESRSEPTTQHTASAQTDALGLPEGETVVEYGGYSIMLIMLALGFVAILSSSGVFLTSDGGEVVDQGPEFTVLNSTATHDGHKVTLVGHEVREEGEDIPEGAVWLYLKIRYENVGAERQSVPGITAEYTGDYKRESEPIYQEEYSSYPSGSEVYPGVTKSGWIYYELPEGINYQLFSLFVTVGSSLDDDETAIKYNLKTGNSTVVFDPVRT